MDFPTNLIPAALLQNDHNYIYIYIHYIYFSQYRVDYFYIGCRLAGVSTSSPRRGDCDVDMCAEPGAEPNGNHAGMPFCTLFLYQDTSIYCELNFRRFPMTRDWYRRIKIYIFCDLLFDENYRITRFLHFLNVIIR